MVDSSYPLSAFDDPDASPMPQEGITGDTLLRFVGGVVLSPKLVLFALLYARYTKHGRGIVDRHPTAWSRFKILFGIAIVRGLNKWFSNRALNNAVQDPRWNWPVEIAVVTGGSGGIGDCIVKLLSEKGVRIAVLDIKSDGWTETGPNIIHLRCDITSPAQISKAATLIRKKWGSPTILINNAGVARGKTILEGSAKDTQFTFEVNAMSHFNMAREFLPYMVDRDHGIVVTVASFAAYLTAPNMVDYSASKAAAMSFHEGLAAELKTRYNAPRVRTILVTQGYTRTALFRGYKHDGSTFAPALDPRTVAREIVTQVFKAKSGHVIAPKIGTLLTWLRGTPAWYQVPLRMNTQGLMKGWNGRQVVNDLDGFYDDKKDEDEKWDVKRRIKQKEEEEHEEYMAQRQRDREERERKRLEKAEGKEKVKVKGKGKGKAKALEEMDVVQEEDDDRLAVITKFTEPSDEEDRKAAAEAKGGVVFEETDESGVLVKEDSDVKAADEKGDGVEESGVLVKEEETAGQPGSLSEK